MTVLAQSFRRPVSARSRLAVDAVTILAGSLFIAALAQVSIKLPFTPVPITGQTLGVLLVGGSFGAVRGGLAVGVYLLQGALGAPFFAGGAGGAGVLAASSATGGYLWGCLIAAAAVGSLAQRGWDRKLGSAIGAMFLGEIIVFTFGVLWLAQALGVGGEKAMQLGLYPFVVGDALKLMIAATALPGARKLVERGSGE